MARPIDRLGLARHDHDGSYGYLDHRLLLHLPQAVRFLSVLRDFRRRYETFKEDCLTMSQAEALRADPLLWGLYREPAVRFIDGTGWKRLPSTTWRRLCTAPLSPQ